MRRDAAALATSCGLLLLTAACAGEPGGTSRGAAAGGATAAPARAAALAPRPDWSVDLPELMPGIAACLARPGAAGAKPVGVTKAWPIGEALVGVRLLEPGDRRLDCVAASAGDRVFLTEPVRPDSRLQGERDPLFTPAPLTPPRSPCLERAAVTEGWLSYDVCRDPRPIGRAARGPVPPRAGVPPREG